MKRWLSFVFSLLLAASALANAPHQTNAAGDRHSSTPPSERPQAPSSDDNLDADAEFQQARAHDLAEGNATWCDAKDKAKELAIDGALNAATMATGGGEGETLYNSLTKAEKAAAAAAKCKAAGEAAKSLPSVAKAVNSELPHAAAQAAKRGIFDTANEAADALRELSKSITQNGFPAGTLPDTAYADRVLVPIGNNGMAVYQVGANGTAKLKTVLVAH